MDQYDAGLLGDGGGGDVEWWQDYIRMLLRQSDEFYEMQHSQILTDLSTEERFRKAEITELRATIAKLDKTADGVPVVPGMKIWFPQPVGPIAGFSVVAITESHAIDEFGCKYSVKLGYSNPNLAAIAAAEAAREERKEVRDGKHD